MGAKNVAAKKTIRDQALDKVVAVIRVRGRVNVRSDIAETLTRLRLKRVNNCIILKLSSSYKGMLNKCVNHVAYGEVDEPTLEKLVLKKGEGLNAKELFTGKYDPIKLKEFMPFRLHPPRHGYRSTKLSFKQGGSLGYMGDTINKLLNRMV
jgi:large subunit ribosomal protein L30